VLCIFDEVLVSAANNKQHGAGMNEIRVKIDADNGAISLYYSGSNVPVNIHKEDIYRPEAVFSSYRTNNKYKDVVVANILSTLCIVQTYDGYKKYKQVSSFSKWCQFYVLDYSRFRSGDSLCKLNDKNVGLVIEFPAI